VPFDFVEQIERLNDEQQLYFYEILAHQLTIATRGVWSDKNATDTEKVTRLKEINEILHRVTARVFNLRRGEDQWAEADMLSFIRGSVRRAPAIGPYVESAITDSYSVVTGIAG
jgi:predicted alpha/beta-fold hydrolase